MSLDLQGEVTASEAELKASATKLFEELRKFNSPKDACVAFAFAHVLFMKACFDPKYKNECFTAIDTHSRLVKEMFSDGLN